MDLISLYKAILASLNITASPEGLLTLQMEDNEFPATIDGKRLVLPTRDVLRAGNWDNLMAFHPLSENPLRGESQVIDMLRRAAGLRCSLVLTDLMQEFAYLGRDTGRHKTIPPKAADVLSAVQGVDEKFVATLVKILERQEPAGANRLMSIYLKRGGTYRGEKAARVAVVDFPILDQIEEEEEIFGVKLRKKDYEILKSLFLYILPDSDDRETYSAPSTSMTAPYFDALMRGFVKVADQLNAVVRTHWDMLKTRFDNPESLLIDTSWIVHFNDLSEFDGQIPALDGNQGAIKSGEEEQAQLAPTPASHAAGVFKVHKSSAEAPARPAQIASDDDVPWKTDEPSHTTIGPPPKTKSPFNTEHVGEALRRPSGPFQVAPAGQFKSAADPNKFDHTGQTKGTKKDEYAEWLERQRAGSYGRQAQTAQYGVPAPMAPVAPVVGYGAPAGYGAPPIDPRNVPGWMAAPGPAPVAPGEYAGRVRGVAVGTAGYGRGVGQPAWLAPVNAPVGYGYPQQAPVNTGYGYGGGGYCTGGSALSAL